MHHWTRARKISLVVHAAFVSIPFALSTVSAFLFWRAMFGDGWLALPMVAVIDVLALTGLVLFIARIPSPFVWLRHLLPIISIVPLGRELYLLLAHNDPWLTWALTLLTTAIFVGIAWQCFQTIERLFIDPVAAARERAAELVSALTTTQAQLEVMSEAVDTFALQRVSYLMTALSANNQQPTVSADIVLTREKAKQLAAEEGVSERTIWRRHKTKALTEAANNGEGEG